MPSVDEIQSEYRYYRVREGSEIFDVIEKLIDSAIKKDYSIMEFERKIGVINSCRDMDLYKSDDYFLAIDLGQDAEKDELHLDLQPISFDEFVGLIVKDNKHYGFVGTGYFHEMCFKPFLETTDK
jgi:hypothetical protein